MVLEITALFQVQLNRLALRVYNRHTLCARSIPNNDSLVSPRGTMKILQSYRFHIVARLVHLADVAIAPHATQYPVDRWTLLEKIHRSYQRS